MVLLIMTESKAKVWSEFLGRDAVAPSGRGVLYRLSAQRGLRWQTRRNRAAVNRWRLFLSPLVTGAMHGLYLVKNGVNFSEFVSNSPYVTVNCIPFY